MTKKYKYLIQATTNHGVFTINYFDTMVDAEEYINSVTSRPNSFVMVKSETMQLLNVSQVTMFSIVTPESQMKEAQLHYDKAYNINNDLRSE